MKLQSTYISLSTRPPPLSTDKNRVWCFLRDERTGSEVTGYYLGDGECYIPGKKKDSFELDLDSYTHWRPVSDKQHQRNEA